MPKLRPITQKEAFAFIERNHRHHAVPVGALWHHAAHDEDGRLCGVAIVGRPVARKIDDGLTCEVTRLCTDGTYNACSLLYAAARRVAIDKGFRRGVTYILVSDRDLMRPGPCDLVETRAEGFGPQLTLTGPHTK